MENIETIGEKYAMDFLKDLLKQFLIFVLGLITITFIFVLFVLKLLVSVI